MMKRMMKYMAGLILGVTLMGMPVSAAGYTVEDAVGVLFTNGQTVILADADANTVLLSSVDAGLPVLVTGVTSNGYFRVDIAGTAYYIPANGLGTDAVAPAPAADTAAAPEAAAAADTAEAAAQQAAAANTIGMEAILGEWDGKVPTAFLENGYAVDIYNVRAYKVEPGTLEITYDNGNTAKVNYDLWRGDVIGDIPVDTYADAVIYVLIEPGKLKAWNVSKKAGDSVWRDHYGPFMLTKVN